ncbi:MAG: response regulator [Arcobacteraceae bacterium]|nr:response regulator [Arcobacteraceae bacterium]
MENIISLKKLGCDYNLLVVEDSKHVNTKLVEYLSKFFLEIDSAEDGQDGLTKFNNKRYDIVITDINMPKMDGTSFIQKLIEIDSNVQIIVASAFGNDENLRTLNKFGIVEFMQKPIDNLKLVDALLVCIENIQTIINNSNITYTLDDPVYEILLELKDTEKTVELINSYQGLTIIQEGYIKDINSKTITIETTNTQYHLIKGEKRTIIVIDNIAIRANLQYVDKENRQLVLKKFETLDRTPKDRKVSRVIPAKDFTLSRYYKCETFSYDVLSLSINSISVKTSALDKSFSDNSHADLILGFQVGYSKHNNTSHRENLLKPVKIRSKSLIYKIDKLVDGSTKIVFVLDLTAEGKKLLEQYIIQREIDILNKLQEIA